MAIQRFIATLRTARSALFGRMNESADSGRPANQASLMDAARRTADIWFTPNLVRDYDEAEFRFLPQPKQQELRAAVEEFRRLTQAVHGTVPTPEQIEQGYDLLVTINNLTPRDFGEEQELYQLRDVSHSVPWPECVRGMSFRLGTDSTGDPAVWIWLMVEDDVVIDSAEVQAELATVREALQEAIQRAGINRWPYISVRTRTETKELVGGAA